jgi:intein-encoded DNA endonuclease-like protein
MKTFSSLDFQLQNEIVQQVINLSWGGFGYKKIIKQIKKEFGVNLSKGLLSYWFNHDVKLYGGQNHFDSKPSKELVYVLGVFEWKKRYFKPKSKWVPKAEY